MTITWTCPMCLLETEVTISPIIPAQTYGPPESCYPEEGGEIDIDECAHCGHGIAQDKILEAASEKARHDYDADET